MLKEDYNLKPAGGSMSERDFVGAVEAVRKSTWGRSTFVVHPQTICNARDIAWEEFQRSLRCLQERARMRSWHWLARRRLYNRSMEHLEHSKSMWRTFGYGFCTYTR